MPEKRKKKNFLQKNYRDSWNYIKNSRNFIFAIILIFLIFIFIGFFISTPSSLAEKILEFLKEILEKTENMNAFELFSFIFWNNLRVSFISMIAGMFLGLFPLFTSMANGYLIGFVSYFVVKENGIVSLWRILPHGIFELPAVIISLGLGLKLGTFIFQKRKKKAFKDYLYNSLKVFFFIVIPLLFIAAVIESGFIYFLK